MRIRGIDFTSQPTRRKPLICIECTLDGDRLVVQALKEWITFNQFERALEEPGPWIAGIDFPFGQSRRFIETAGWPLQWPDYVAYASALGRNGFRDALERYRAGRPYGDKEHRRATDVAASSISPQKLYGVPVALMFFEGARRIAAANVTIPGLQAGDPERIVVEAYPGALARYLIGRTSYKHDNRRRQTSSQLHARLEIIDRLLAGQLAASHGLTIVATKDLLPTIRPAISWMRSFARFRQPGRGTAG